MSETTRPLALVKHLCDTLASEDVQYCHWKSNEAIDRSASGENDLDLLINRSHAGRFTEILYRLGFRELQAPAARMMPGVQDFYGCDVVTGRFVHVQAHYQLILGHDRTKNFRLPIEDAYLASSAQSGLFRLPAAEFEYVVFIVRMVLKHATWDSQLGRQGELSKTEQAELIFLEDRIDRERVSAVIDKNLPFLTHDVFAECVRVVRSESHGVDAARTAAMLQKALQGQARHGRATDAFLRVSRRTGLAIGRRISRRTPKYRLATGGSLIAIVGGDGAGKSTAVEELHQWLAEELDVRHIHLGKPPQSWRTLAVRGSLRSIRAILPWHSRDHVDDVPAVGRIGLAGYTRVLWLSCVARDRYRTYRTAKRFVIGGGIVISDRYPLPGLRLMDAPQIETLMHGRSEGGVYRRLSDAEKRLHRAIGDPDLLIVLRVDPEIAVARKPDESAESVRTRSGEVWALDWRATDARVVDASQSKELVLAELKSLIWSALEA